MSGNRRQSTSRLCAGLASTGRNVARPQIEGGFALGAGVDSILSKLREHPEMLPLSIPLFRLEDTGMGLQMQEYAVSRTALVPPL